MSVPVKFLAMLSVLASIDALALVGPATSPAQRILQSTSAAFGTGMTNENKSNFDNHNRSSSAQLPPASNIDITQSSQNALLTVLLNLQNIFAFVIAPATYVNHQPNFQVSMPRVITQLTPKDCVIDDTKGDECEEILKDDSPNTYVFCRNSDQNNRTSLKVCTFTHVNDATTHATTSPTVENKQCVVSKAGGLCDEVCKGLWSRGFINSKTNARFTYSFGKSYDCAFKTTTTSQRWEAEKLTCGCAQLATRQNK